MKPNVLIFSGYGFNSEEETQFAFEQAGATAQTVHINDIIDGQVRFDQFQILAFPGGFSYGDDTGSGNAFANKLRNHLWEDVQKFVQQDKLIIGICNGFQVLVNLGLLPAFDGNYGVREVALLNNQTARLVTRWTDMVVAAKTPWLDGITHLSAPIAHGEGKFYASEKTLQELKQKNLIALRYVQGETCEYASLPANPNGSTDNIAGIIDESGKVLGLMPHPERGMFFTQRPDFGYLKEKYKREGKPLPEFIDGIKIFQNAVKYFQ
jgi:phosphoribosylformylglycinamidine synthase subunit PurQ / glutaminase